MQYRWSMRPGEVPVDDRENTVAMEAYDSTGIAAAFDQHAQGLFTYCLSRLRVHAEAGNAVQDTFIIASYKAPGLGRSDRLRAWLFAVARNECHRRLQRAAPSAPLYEAAEAMDDTGQLSAITEQGELRALVRVALAELDPVEREICELNLRHGLTGADLGAVLGVPQSQAQALASRARARFERSLGVLLMARAERESCFALAAILDGSSGKPAVLLRRRVRQHIKRCPVCSSGLRRPGLAPAMLLSMLTVPALPRDLRPRTLRLVSDPSPEATAYRDDVMDRAAPFGADGFPVQLTTPTVPRGKSFVVLAAALAAAALALLGGGTYYVDYTSTHTGPPPATSSPSATKSSSTPTKAAATKAPDRTPSASAPAVVPVPVPSVVPTTAAPTHSASPKPSASKSPTPTPSKSPTPTPTHSPTPTPTPTTPTPTPTTSTPTTPTTTPASPA
jgi:RNA polymerase sigma factor (sigma-70 family)